jgi:hypothetical protein
MWKISQLTVFLAVVFSHLYYDWGHGGSLLAVSVVALAAAWLSTAAIIAIRDLLRRAKALLLRCQQRINDRRPSRR